MSILQAGNNYSNLNLQPQGPYPCISYIYTPCFGNNVLCTAVCTHVTSPCTSVYKPCVGVGGGCSAVMVPM